MRIFFTRGGVCVNTSGTGCGCVGTVAITCSTIKLPSVARSVSGKAFEGNPWNNQRPCVSGGILTCDPPAAMAVTVARRCTSKAS